jgi:hypothetical protein
MVGSAVVTTSASRPAMNEAIEATSSVARWWLVERAVVATAE